MKDTEKAFIWISNILEQHKIVYKISGGFAARSYGVNRDLYHLDIDVANKDIQSIIPEVRPYIIFGPANYRDAHWDLELMTLSYEGQEIDIAGADSKIFNQETKKWESYLSDFKTAVSTEVYGKKVLVESLESLIAYKSKLAREVDLEDVRQLKNILKAQA